MAFVNNYTLNTFRVSLITLIGWLFISFYPASHCQAQSISKDISVTFIKQNDSIKATGLYFNVFRICNNSLKPVSGAVSFNGPENWKIISFPFTQTNINPGDTALIPVRISPVADAIGGITYILNATFATREHQYNTNTYLTIPTISRWEFSIDQSKLYFTENSPNADFQIKLRNKGNTNELIKLDYKIGKLLQFPKISTNEYVEFIKLPAFKDTTITQTVMYQNNLSYAEKMRFENNWKESSVNTIASADNMLQSSSIMIRRLNSSYYNQRIQNSSPLNIDYQVFNLMSNQQPRSNLRVFGSILYPNNRALEYMLGIQNIYFNKFSLDVDKQLFYSIRYTDNRNNIELGYNINGGYMHPINGRGISGTYKFSPITKISYALTQNTYNQTLGEYIALYTSIKGFSFNTEVTHEDNPNGNYSATSALFGTGFTFFKHHNISFQVLGSQSLYNVGAGRDTSVIGYSYKINYSLKYKKFDLRLNAFSSQNNFIRNSGSQQLYFDSKYQLSDKIVFSLYGNRQYYATTHYPYNFFNPVSYNSTDYLRFTSSISAGNITYQLGPSYNGSMRQFFNPVSGYQSEYKTYQPGVWGSATFKLNGYRSITPNVTVTNLRFYYNTNDPLGTNYALDKNIYYTVGLNYFDTNWRVNAYYSSGSASDLYRSIQIDIEPKVSSSIQFRPSYENYFFNRKMKLSAYVNYAYYMPSGRENTSYNIKTDLFLKNGLVLYVSGFMYSNVRSDELTGRISTKDLNLIVGITKSFNFQQPRQKYYNFKSVFFNDLDGNRIKTDNESPVSNVLVNIQKDRSNSKSQSTIPEVELLSDVNGQIYFENLPKDNYKLTFKPLVNLQSLYFLNGSEQGYYSDKDRTLYVPLAESYKIKGKIILIRDPNSTEGKIDLGGIRITGTGMKGETYSVLTDNFGSFIINVPYADKYIVHINNVFGDQFSIDANETQVQFSKNKTINLDFTFIEKQRGIEFDGGGEIYKFNSLNSETADSGTTTQVEPITEKPVQLKKDIVVENKKNKSEKINSPVIVAAAPPKAETKTEPKVEPKVEPKTFAIQLDVLKNFKDPAYYQDKYKLKNEVLYTNINGEFKYYSGEYQSIEMAKADIAKIKIQGFPVEIDKKLLKKGVPPEYPQSYTIQLDALKTYRDPSFYQKKYNLKTDVVYLEEDGYYKYFTGEYSAMSSTKADIAKLKLNGFAVTVDRKLLKRAAPVEKIEVKVPSTNKEVARTNPITGVKTVNKTAPNPVVENFVYEKDKPFSIELDALNEFRDPTYYNAKYGFKEEVLYIFKDGVYTYYYGNYETQEAAKGDIARYGISGYIVQIDKSLLKNKKSN